MPCLHFHFNSHLRPPALTNTNLLAKIQPIAGEAATYNYRRNSNETCLLRDVCVTQPSKRSCVLTPPQKPLELPSAERSPARPSMNIISSRPETCMLQGP